MNDFFALSDGSPVKQETKGTFESNAGFDPIPSKTNVLAVAVEVKWQDPHPNSGDTGKQISIRWDILSPKEYKGRQVFQKIKAYDSDEKKFDNARRMLAAIDDNAGGKLMDLDREPTDSDLSRAFVNKPMILMLQKWDFSGKTGNWVSAVSPKSGSTSMPKANNEEVVNDTGYAIEDDIPF